MEMNWSRQTTQLPQPALSSTFFNLEKFSIPHFFAATVEQNLSTVITQFTKPQEHVFTLW